jgi:hypothetical protein
MMSVCSSKIETSFSRDGNSLFVEHAPLGLTHDTARQCQEVRELLANAHGLHVIRQLHRSGCHGAIDDLDHALG